MLMINERVEIARKEIGWIYNSLKWLNEDEARIKNQERARILDAISSQVKYAFSKNKVYLGDLSPGCLICGGGAWSCMFINSLCTANCFFCPQDRKINKERVPLADGFTFDKPADYLEYLEKYGFRGVGFSGGETMLVFQRLLSYIKSIRERFGKDFYIWIYTNGDLINTDKLRRLKRAGLDEIRFNICARNYDLSTVELAVKFIDNVTVEIPAIPEDIKVLKKSIIKMQKIGVKYLNIHQLVASEHNYNNFINRNYTFLHFSGVIPILESELTALNIIKFIIDNDIDLPVNYCSAYYKHEFQSRGHRRRAAFLVRSHCAEQTDSGYIRYLSIKDSAAKIRMVINNLKKNKCSNDLWYFNREENEVYFCSSLFNYFDFSKYKLIIRYIEPRFMKEIIAKEKCEKPKSSHNKNIYVEEKIVYKGELTLVGAACYYQLFIKNMKEDEVLNNFFTKYLLRSRNDLKILMEELNKIVALKVWEKMEIGFPVIR